MGRAPARRFAQADGDARPADRTAGSGGQSRSSARQNGAASANPAGVGPITAVAYVLTPGKATRFPRGKQVASYLGLIAREHSSGGRQKLGAITKQGNRMLRMLLVEAAQIAVRYDPEFRREYLHRCHQKPKAVAKWQRHASWRYDCTGCCARRGRIRTSFASRAARGWPWSARARPKELIGRSRIPHRRDVRIAESWPSVRSNRWLVERLHRRVIQVRFPESWSSTFSGEKAVLTHRPGYFCLDNAFALIEGHPAAL